MSILCKCGRSLDSPVPHCPYCGTTNVRPYDTASVSVGQAFSQGFRCRRCAKPFHEMQECKAPPKRQQIKMADRILNANPYLKETVRRVAEKHGYKIKPESVPAEDWEEKVSESSDSVEPSKQ